MPGSKWITSRPWSQAERDKLRKLWRDGVGPSGITRHLPGRTKNAIICQARNLELPKMREDALRPPRTTTMSRAQPLARGARTLPPLPSEMSANE